MALDNFKNGVKVTVSTGYDAAATSIVLNTGDGAKLPTAPFNAVWFNASDYGDPSDDPNVEIVRVTAIATDTLTITRATESIASNSTAQTHNTSAKVYKLIPTITAKTLNTDIPVLSFKSGTTTKNTADASTTQTIAHGLGKTPVYVRLTAITNIGPAATNNYGGFAAAFATYNGTQASISDYVTGNTPVYTADATLTLGTAEVNSTNTQVGVITVDSTNINIAWTKSGSPSGTYQILWEAIG